MIRRFSCLMAVMVASLAAPAGAADLKVTSAGAVRGLIAQIIDDYSRQTGQKFDFTIGTTGQLRNISGVETIMRSAGWPDAMMLRNCPVVPMVKSNFWPVWRE